MAAITGLVDLGFVSLFRERLFALDFSSTNDPFYLQAEEKGASASVYGLIIGTNCLTSFIVTPFIGKNVSRYLFLSTPRLRFQLRDGSLNHSANAET